MDSRPTASTTMTVETVHYDDTVAGIRVTGELDIATSPPLWAVLECHHLAGRRFLRLDMSGVTFLDASALRGIVTVHERLLADRGTLVLTGVRRPVARVLRMTRLDETLLIGGWRADGDAFTAPDALDLAGADFELAGR